MFRRRSAVWPLTPCSGEVHWKLHHIQDQALYCLLSAIDEYRKMFAHKQIACVEYQDITDVDEREIFQVCLSLLSCMIFLYSDYYFLKRVQLGRALTPSGQFTILSFLHNLEEKLQVINGPRASFI